MRISDWSSDVCSSDLPPFRSTGCRSSPEGSVSFQCVRSKFCEGANEVLSVPATAGSEDRLPTTSSEAKAERRSDAKRMDMSGHQSASAQAESRARNRSEESREGKERVGKGRSRWST